MLDSTNKFRSNQFQPLFTNQADILKNHRRRGVISLLKQEENKLSNLANSILNNKEPNRIDQKDAIKKIAIWENSNTDTIDQKEKKRAQTSLTQNHIPRLEEENIINYRPNDNVIEASEPEIYNYMPLVEEKPHQKSLFPGITKDKENYLTADQGFKLLSNDRRQRTIQYIDNYQQDSIIDVSDLAEYIASFESEELFNSSDRKKIYISLIQSHLPCMNDSEVLEYDKDRKLLSEGKYFETISRFLPEEIQ